MSGVKSEKSHVSLLKLDKECTTGKPCIDFQPDDRWQINEDGDPSCNVKRQLRNRSNSSQGSASSPPCKPMEEMNGEATKGDSEDDDIVSSSGHTNDVNSEKESSRKLCNNVNNKDPKIDAKSNGIETENSASDISTDNVKDMEVEDDNQLPQSTNGTISKKRKHSGSSDESDNAVKKSKANLSPSEKCTDDSSDCQDSKQPSTNTDSKETGHEKENDKSSIILCDENAEPKSSSEEIVPADQKKLAEATTEECSSTSCNLDKSAASSELKKNSNAEIIVSDGDESDNDIQIISSTTKIDVQKTYQEVQSFLDDKTSCNEDVLLSAGYPYFNSLQEKFKSFKAGKYKPVKFPHMGTLMLEENEVIIESPSLLVPLLIKESDEFPKASDVEKDGATGSDEVVTTASVPKTNPIFKRNFFQSSVGQFLINMGASRVLEWYHRDMKRSKMKHCRKSGHTQELDDAIVHHNSRFNAVKEANAAFTFRPRKCQFCDFKTESRLVLDSHYLTPHLTPRREYKCNFCSFITRDAREITFHFEAVHNKKALLEDQMILHECLFCSFQSHLKTKVNVHMNRCRKNFIPSQNLSPPFDFEFPGVTTKPVTIADVVAHRRMLLGVKGNQYQNIGAAPSMDSFSSAFARKKLASVLNIPGAENYPDSPTLVKHLMGQQTKQAGSGFQLPPGLVLTRPRVRPQQMRPGQVLQPQIPGLRQPGAPRNAVPFLAGMNNSTSQVAPTGLSITPVAKQIASSGRAIAGTQSGMKNITLTPISAAGNQVVLQKPGPPQPVALFTNVAGSDVSRNRASLGQVNRMPVSVPGRSARVMPPYQRLNTPPSQVVKNSSGNTFVMCEICDSYIKDLDELRSHMNWVHKVKIHPKMLVSRPPLNCQKCQWRFFTDQGLERHLLGAHGLVTTNMQEMANKNQDGGRCIICGAVFTYKLVSHMTQVHKVTLKPAHLSYKCTVCTATFTLYRLFESHVYNVHSASAKRPAEETSNEPPAKKASPAIVSEEQKKPVKTDVAVKTDAAVKADVVQPKPAPTIVAVKADSKKCKECDVDVEDLHDHIIEKHMKKCSVKLCRIEKCEKCLCSSDNEMLLIRMDELGLGGDSDASDDDSSEESDDSSDTDSLTVMPRSEGAVKKAV